MTTRNDEAGTGHQPTAPRSQHGNDLGGDTTSAQPIATGMGSTDALITTIEIPITTARPRIARSPRDYYDAGYSDRQRRPSAPVGLRIAVWILFFIFVLALIGLAVEHYHPTWVSFLRQTTSTSGLRASSSLVINALF